ncbi:hypothetical protein [Pedobacter yulinensis]|uniref:hypothetical protein n=1 Tax=Pedobacter yulinensis TaxID=2126353 RepID=UPI0013A685CA|nr:hypothetical protein [Pedobacter yulinensis]
MSAEPLIEEMKTRPQADDSFWRKYSKFAKTEILMYLVMVIGIALGILLLS